MRGRLIRRDDLGAAERAAMLALFRRHFVQVDPRQFERDLDAKDWVLLLERADGRLAGFSSLLYYRTTVGSEKLAVVYSGDTIVDAIARGSSALSRGWIDAVHSLHDAAGGGRLVWLLLTSGFRTYRFLPVYTREFWPRWEQTLPPPARRLRDTLARERFGERYDGRSGIVAFEHPCALRPALRRVPATRRRDPHVAFFLRANPGHARGDELVCVADLDPGNLTPAARRVVAAARRRRQRPAGATP